MDRIHSRSGGPLAVVVEDNEFSMSVLDRLLTSSGFRVLEAWCGSDALRIARALPYGPALVVCDLKLPDGRGTAVAGRLLARHPGTPVLLTSGTPLEGWSTDELSELDDLLCRTRCDFLEKPFHADTLRSKVSRLTESERREPASSRINREPASSWEMKLPIPLLK